jgi:hypothetical protein
MYDITDAFSGLPLGMEAKSMGARVSPQRYLAGGASVAGVEEPASSSLSG